MIALGEEVFKVLFSSVFLIEVLSYVLYIQRYLGKKKSYLPVQPEFK